MEVAYVEVRQTYMIENRVLNCIHDFEIQLQKVKSMQISYNVRNEERI